MTREEEIRQASIEYTMGNAPKCIGGDAFSEVMDGMNRNHAFEEGAKWADEHPKNPWISVKDDLPCNRAEMLNPTCNIKTQCVITSIEGLCYINQMVKYRNEWIWEMDKPTHWMPIPKLPQELDYVRD